MKHPISNYTVTKLCEDTYSIRDSGIGQGDVYLYLLVGTERALLVDSGYGLLDLPAIVGEITALPVTVICTHGHLDHAPGTRHFSETYLHSADAQIFREHTNPEFLKEIGDNGIAARPRKVMREDPEYRELLRRMQTAEYPLPAPLEKRDIFDLGGRIISWSLVPGHTQGSVAVLDETKKLAFDGDAFPPGVWLFLKESSPLPEYVGTARRYAALLREKGITTRYAGHTDKPLTPQDTEALAACAEKAIAKPKRGFKVHISSFGDARMVFGSGTVVFCPPVR